MSVAGGAPRFLSYRWTAGEALDGLLKANLAKSNRERLTPIRLFEEARGLVTKAAGFVVSPAFAMYCALVGRWRPPRRLTSDLTGFGEVNMIDRRISKFFYAAGAAALFAGCMSAIANGAERRRIVQFQMTSTTFKDGDYAPLKMGYAPMPGFENCFGQNLSPQLSWTNVRPEVKSFALTVHELEDPPNYSLVVYGIPADIRSFAEGELSKPSDKFVGGSNSRKQGTYRGFCPNYGQKKHYQYEMRGTDLDPKALPPGLTAQELAAKLEGHTFGIANLIARFDVDLQLPK